MTSTSTLYQGLQSCLEPPLVEPHVLMNKLPPPISNFPQSTTLLQMSNISPQTEEEKDENGLSFNELQNQHDNSDMGCGWSFIHELENPCQYPKKGDAEDEEVYVHPLEKLSSLNTKSLEMCTESLGSETGSDISESMEEFSPFMSERETNFHGFQLSKSREFTKKFNRGSSFPPPLTSMSGNEGVQVRPHREGGRLVLKAVTINSCNSYFHAERGDGRLRLSLLRHEECSYEEEDDEISQENEDENTNENEDDEICSRKLGSHDIGVGEYGSSSRCKASESRNKGVPSWEPFWVAIS